MFLLHSSNAEYGAGFQQHFRMGTLCETLAKTDFFCLFFEYRRAEHATVDDNRKVRKT